jgi:hypothetical protein
MKYRSNTARLTNAIVVFELCKEKERRKREEKKRHIKKFKGYKENVANRINTY